MGGEFYWICDCIAVKEILEYNGSIHQLRRWSHELLGYEFAIIYRASSMMKDADILIYSSIAISLKRVVCVLPILQSDHFLIVSILLFLVLISVVSLLLILL